MRVDYTLPALQQGTLLEAEPNLPGSGPSFRDQLRGTTVHLPVSWEQQLHLDARPLSATFIGPPPRPYTLDLNDSEAERARWRNMVFRHSRSLEAGGTPVTSRSRQAVQVMLEMLVEMQHMEDSISYRNAAVTRG
jgi:hypothetical protein